MYIFIILETLINTVLSHHSSSMDNSGTICGTTFGGGSLNTAEIHNGIQLIEPNGLNLTGTAKL